MRTRHHTSTYGIHTYMSLLYVHMTRIHRFTCTLCVISFVPSSKAEDVAWAPMIASRVKGVFKG